MHADHYFGKLPPFSTLGFAGQTESFLRISRSAKALRKEHATAVVARLERARELLGGVNPLSHFAHGSRRKNACCLSRDDPLVVRYKDPLARQG
ncbi:MAG TPA: hypothetical protein VNJ04_11470 [Gemmatimonadaceae bacterium]|nr:hypothetical protein [Gemmatimonadaceae bacterium]